MSEALPLRTKLGFGAGDFGFNLVFSGVQLYLLYYYTDVLGISAAVAGLAFMGALIWDGITDPLMGLLAQRTRSRWGSYRPYLLFGGIPLALSFCLMYLAPDYQGNALVLYVFATHVLFRTAYTVASIPFSSLMARITRDSMERNSLAGFRMVGATLGALTVAFTTLKLAEFLGDGDMKAGFRSASLIFGAVAVLMLWLTFATTRESAPAQIAHKYRFKEVMAMLLSNGPFLTVFAATLISMSCTTLFSKTLVYYFKYNLDAEASIGLALFTYIGVISLLTPFWMWVTKKTSKRSVWLIGSGLLALGLLVFSFYRGQQLDVVLPILLLCGAGASAFPLTFWSMLPDTVEYGEWKSGVRAESFVFGLVSLAQKVALGVAVGVLGFLLDAIGFEANVAQGADTLAGIRFIMTWLPILGILLAAAVIWFYRLDALTHSRIVAELKARS